MPPLSVHYKGDYAHPAQARKCYAGRLSRRYHSYLGLDYWGTKCCLFVCCRSALQLLRLLRFLRLLRIRSLLSLFLFCTAFFCSAGREITDCYALCMRIYLFDFVRNFLRDRLILGIFNFKSHSWRQHGIFHLMRIGYTTTPP